MGILDRLLGRSEDEQGRTANARPPIRQSPADPDEAAIKRYRYMLRTAPPETIEQAHAEAFAKLTPDQRKQVLDHVGAGLDESEQARSTDPRDLARMATRAEVSRPGTMERSLGGGAGMGGMGGMGGMIAGSLLASVAGAVIGTSIAGAFLGGDENSGDGDSADGDSTGDESGADSTGGEESGGDYAADSGGAGDFGGDFGGDIGTDFGGGF